MQTPPSPAPSTPSAPPSPSPAIEHFAIEPGLCFLNHGSFGACPRLVLDAQARYRAQVEADAVTFYCQALFAGLARSRDAIASLAGGEPGDYVFLPNATTGVATVLENVARGHGLADPRPLGPGDELLAFTLEYPACMHNLDRLAERTGAEVVRVPLDAAPREGRVTAAGLREALMGAVTERTRVCMLSHIFSAGGFVAPVKAMVADLHARGVTTIVDGAHVPGAIDVDIPSIGATFYAANCHKWTLAPKGAAVLWVHPDAQQGFRPMVLSNYAFAPDGTHSRSRYNLEFDYAGTDDATGYLAIADAVKAMPTIAGVSWPEQMRRNRELALRGRDILCERLGAEPPVDDDLLGPMATVPLPDMPEHARSRPSAFADPLQDELLRRWRIQVPIWSAGGQMPGQRGSGRRLVRISAQVYNNADQYAYLADALVAELERERSL